MAFELDELVGKRKMKRMLIYNQQGNDRGHTLLSEQLFPVDVEELVVMDENESVGWGEILMDAASKVSEKP